MKAAKYTSARLLWNTVAYCDQEKKIMAIYSENKDLLGVISETYFGHYDILLVGENEILYDVDGVELGTVKKNMETCFKLYRKLRDVYNPTIVAVESSHRKIKTYEILTHSKVGVMRNGQFHKIDDASSEIEVAQAAMDMAKKKMEPRFIGEEYPVTLVDWAYDLAGGDQRELAAILSGLE